MCAYILRVCVGDGVRVGDGLVGERAYGGCFQCIFIWSGLHLFCKGDGCRIKGYMASVFRRGRGIVVRERET